MSETSEKSSPSVSLETIQAAVALLDYAAEQGAFRGWAVMERASAVRNTINNFLQAVVPAKQPEAPTE